MLLNDLHAELASLYETPVGYDVYDFLITDARLAAALTPESASHQNHERLLLQSSAEDLRLSLYIDAEVLELLGSDDPTVSLHAGNINEFLIALEGISHFSYLIWNAERDNQVSLLEMELQAEVDKYVASAKLMSHQLGGAVPHLLHRQLFEAVRFDDSLSAEAQTRYQEANYYAARYCYTLRNRFPGHHHQLSFLRELRGFYRLTQNEKIRHIRAAS